MSRSCPGCGREIDLQDESTGSCSRCGAALHPAPTPACTGEAPVAAPAAEPLPGLPDRLEALVRRLLARDPSGVDPSVASELEAIVAAAKLGATEAPPWCLEDTRDDAGEPGFSLTRADRRIAERLPGLAAGIQLGRATLRHRREHRGGASLDVLEVAGHLTGGEALDFSAFAVALILGCEHALVLDLASVRFLGSACLGALVRAQDAARHAKKAIYLLPMPLQGEQTFKVLGLESFLSRAGSVDEAASLCLARRSGRSTDTRSDP
ncbi:STAS domain-containing protein [bacterium]|nr:STAS domain-containing protein [bacterium]